MNRDDPIANDPDVKRIVETCLKTYDLSYSDFKQIIENYNGDDLHVYTILMLIGIHIESSWLFALKAVYARMLGWHSTSVQWERRCKTDAQTCQVFTDIDDTRSANRYKP